MNIDNRTLFFEQLVKSIQLSKTAVDSINQKFDSLTTYIDNNFGEDNVKIFPQGSYALGTTIKPLNASEDDFDVDIIVCLSYSEDDAYKIKHSIGDLLLESDKYRTRIDEKGRAWTITYDNSHIDVVPAKNNIFNNCSPIKITDKDKDLSNYNFMISDPKKYKEWFYNKGFSVNSDNRIQASIEKLPENNYRRNNLQKVIQILKYHRNVYFENLQDDKVKPISMLITTIVAELYTDTNDLFDDLSNVVLRIPDYLEKHKNYLGEYHIFNPVDKDEEFTDKWLDNPERKEAFIDWTKSLNEDLIKQKNGESIIEFSNRLKSVFGKDIIINTFNNIGVLKQQGQNNGEINYTKSDGISIGSQREKNVKRNNFYGD